MALTARDILRATPTKIKDAAADVAVVDIVKRRTAKDRMRIEAIVESRSRAGLKHRVVIESVEIGARSLNTAHIRVWCSCEFFKWYGCADVLYKANAGFKSKATGIMPDMRNPSYRPFVCPHVIRVMRNRNP